MASLRQFLHRHEHGPGHPGLGVRSHVALHHSELDRDLAGWPARGRLAGTRRARPPAVGPARPPRFLAGCIDGVLARAEHPPHWHSTALAIEAAGVLAARANLKQLRDALLADDCRSVRGVALASVLLHDEHSPVFTAFADTTVAALARSATAAMSAAPDDALTG